MSAVPRSQRFSRSHRCPICGGGADDRRGQGVRCHGFLSSDGAIAFCTREEHAGSLREVPGSGYAHRPEGVCACGATHTDPRMRAGRAANGHRGKLSPGEHGRITRDEIHDEAGRIVAMHVREDLPGGDKRMWWEQPDGTRGLGGRAVKDLPLYGADDLAAAPPGAPVVVTEGEKARKALKERGILAVGTVTGAKARPSDHVLRVLLGHPTTLWPDNDDTGASHMRRIAERLAGLKHDDVLALAWAEAPPKGDAHDFFEHGGTVEECRGLIAAAAPVLVPGDATSQALSAPAPRGRWRLAKTSAELLDAGVAEVEWLDSPLVARGVIT